MTRALRPQELLESESNHVANKTERMPRECQENAKRMPDDWMKRRDDFKPTVDSVMTTRENTDLEMVQRCNGTMNESLSAAPQK
jgi:hypothetical protein